MLATPMPQNSVASNLLDKVVSLLRNPPDYLQELSGLGPMQILLLISCGLVFLLYGWRLFKALVIVDAGALGVLVGSSLLESQNMAVFGGIAGALLFAALAWPLMKYAVSLLGGLAGAFVGYGMWHCVAGLAGRPELAAHAWAGAMIGLITLGLLAFVIFRVTVVVVTVLQGSLMAVSGSIALAMLNESWRAPLQDHLSNPRVLPLLILVPAIVGFTLQQSLTCKTGKSKSKSAGG